jgi:hypothetical protein
MRPWCKQLLGPTGIITGLSGRATGPTKSEAGHRVPVGRDINTIRTKPVGIRESSEQFARASHVPGTRWYRAVPGTWYIQVPELYISTVVRRCKLNACQPARTQTFFLLAYVYRPYQCVAYVRICPCTLPAGQRLIRLCVLENQKRNTKVQTALGTTLITAKLTTRSTARKLARTLHALRHSSCSSAH